MRFEPLESGAPSQRGRKRRLLLPGMLLLCGLLAVMFSISAWNYFDVSLRQVTPSTRLTETADAKPIIFMPPSGVIKRTFQAGGDISAPPAIYDGTAYIVLGRRTETGSITALDLETWMPAWTYTLNGVSDFRPSVAGDFLYAVSRDGRTIALDRHTGQEIWTHSSKDIVLGSPVVRDGVLYVASDGIQTLDAVTGELLWTHETEGGRTISPLTFSDGILAVLSEGSHLNLVDAAKGKRRRTARLWFGGADAPVILGDTVVLSGDRGRIQAIDLYARDVPMEKALRFWWTKLWLYKSAPRPPDPVGYLWHHRGIGGLMAKVVAARDDRLYFVARNADHSANVTALDANTGDALWKFTSQAPVAGGTVLVDGTLVFGTHTGEVLGLSTSTGEVEWRLSMGIPISSIAVAGNGTLLLASQKGAIHEVR